MWQGSKNSHLKKSEVIITKDLISECEISVFEPGNYKI